MGQYILHDSPHNGQALRASLADCSFAGGEYAHSDPPIADIPPVSMRAFVRLEDLKRMFVYCTIGAIIAAAAIAVVSVLLGAFGDVTAKLVATLVMVLIHSVFGLVFLWDTTRRRALETMTFFVDVLFIAVMLSFVTSIFGIWNVWSGELVVRLYNVYVLCVFSALHANVLVRYLDVATYLDRMIRGNLLAIALVVVLLLPVLLIQHPERVLGSFYFRLLTAATIVDGALTVLTYILFRLHLHEHPKVRAKFFGKPDPAAQAMNPWLRLFIIYICLQIALPLLWMLFVGLAMMLGRVR